MKTQYKFIPFPELVMSQLLLIIVPLSGLLIIFYKVLNGIWMIVSISLVACTIICNFVCLILSFIIWWNVPLVIDEKGITKKLYGKRKTYSWEKAVSIKNIRFGHTSKGPLCDWVVIEYSSGDSIRFGYGKLTIKHIKKLCQDPHFLEMLDEVVRSRE